MGVLEGWAVSYERGTPVGVRVELGARDAEALDSAAARSVPAPNTGLQGLLEIEDTHRPRILL